MVLDDLSPSGLNFKKIIFGKADAFEESNSPQLLIEGYLDAYGYINDILDGDKYYVFGQKGSGKTAIGSKLKLMSESNNEFYTDIIMLNQFDFSGFSGVIPGNADPDKKNIDTWEFLLAIKFIEAYDNFKNTYCSNKNVNPKNIRKGLEDVGLLPCKDFNSIIDRMKHRDISIETSIASVSIGKVNPTNIKRMITNVVNAVYSIIPSKKHLIIIDGLDSILGKRENEYRVLSSLIHAANIINNKFRELNIPSKVIILCRIDVFDKLKDPNKTKYALDSGIFLDWYQDVSEVKETNLNKLINLRAEVSLNRSIDVIDEFFPPYIYSPNKSTIKTLLEFTRHTPRDFIQLINSIQNVSYTKGASVNSVKNGIRKYSDNYFYPEIIDGLCGLISDNKIDLVFNALKIIGHTETDVYEITKELECHKTDVIEMLTALYNAGAIGNIFTVGNKQFIKYKFRNRHESFNEKQRVLIHPGLHKALGLTNQNHEESDLVE